MPRPVFALQEEPSFAPGPARYRPPPAAKAHAALAEAVRDGRFSLEADPRVYSRMPGVGNLWELLLPLQALAIFTLLVLIFWGVAAGVAALLVTAFVLVGPVQWFIRAQVRRRAVTLALRDAETFQRMWQAGGLVLGVSGLRHLRCPAPKGDWRRFVDRNLAATNAQHREGTPGVPAPRA